MNDFNVQDVVAYVSANRAVDQGADFARLWRETVAHFRQEFTGLNFEQKWKSVGGKAFEHIVIGEAERILAKPDIAAMGLFSRRWAQLERQQKEEFAVPMFRKCANKEHRESNEPDIVIYQKSDGGDVVAKAILSCKVSLKDRVSIDLYWSDVYAKRNIKFLVVTANPRDELGSHDKPKKPRAIAECIYERLYVVDGDVTDYCSTVVRFSQLENDLTRWFSHDK
jgi:hypothetical protein